MEKGKKKETQNTIITIFLFAVVAIGFIGGFVLAGDLKERIYRANKKETTIVANDDIMAAGVKGDKTLGFDEKYVQSDEDLDYIIDFGTYAGSTDSYFTIEYGDRKNELKIVRYNYDDSDESQEYTMSFVNNVVDVYFGQFNDDPQYNALFYLLENGDVCYSIIEDMVLTNSYGSYYSINELSNIAKFYNGSGCSPVNGTCKSTTFAQARDGKIYDLGKYIN